MCSNINGKKRIQYYDSMGGDGYKYSGALFRYLKDEWSDKKGGQLPDADKKNPEIIKAMRHFDYTVNITWVVQHLNVAIKYIDHSGKGDGEATGGSDWQKYMHPKYQKRIFFSFLLKSYISHFVYHF